MSISYQKIQDAIIIHPRRHGRHLLLKKPLDGRRITGDDRSRIQALPGISSLEDTKIMVRRMVKDFIRKVYGNNGGIWQYLEGECDNIIVKMVHSNQIMVCADRSE